MNPDGSGDVAKISLFLENLQARFKEQARTSLSDSGGSLFDSKINILFQLLDADNSGDVSLEEFSAIYPSAASYFFSVLDTDSNGTLDKEEISHLFVKPDGSKDFEKLTQFINQLQGEIKKQARQAADTFTNQVKSIIFLSMYTNSVRKPRCATNFFDLIRDTMNFSKFEKQKIKFTPGGIRGW